MDITINPGNSILPTMLVLVALPILGLTLGRKGLLRSVWQNRHGLLRAVWRLTIYQLLVLLLILGGLLVYAPFAPDIDRETLSGLASLPIGIALATYLIISVAVFAASAVMVKRFDRRPIAGIGLGLHSKWGSELLIGLVMGALFVTAVVTMQSIGAGVRLTPAGVEGGELIKNFALYALLFIGTAFMEELIFRGYILQILAEGAGKVLAAILISAPFGLVHYFNAGGTWYGAVSTGVAGLLLSLAYFKTRSLWLPIGIHITWNFFMGWVYSLPVSGEHVPITPFHTSAAGPDWLTGGSFGPEGSILAFLVMGIMMLFLLRSRSLAASREALAWYPPPEERIRRSEGEPNTITEPEEEGR